MNSNEMYGEFRSLINARPVTQKNISKAWTICRKLSKNLRPIAAHQIFKIIEKNVNLLLLSANLIYAGPQRFFWFNLKDPISLDDLLKIASQMEMFCDDGEKWKKGDRFEYSSDETSRCEIDFHFKIHDRNDPILTVKTWEIQTCDSILRSYKDLQIEKGFSTDQEKALLFKEAIFMSHRSQVIHNIDKQAGVK